jgi:hypothetical protein
VAYRATARFELDLQRYERRDLRRIRVRRMRDVAEQHGDGN